MGKIEGEGITLGDGVTAYACFARSEERQL